MAEADDSGDHIAKEKAKYRYKKEWRIRDGKKVLVNVGTPIKQPEPYIGKGGVVITGEHKPEYKKRIKKTSRQKNYANVYKRKKYQ